MTLDPDQPHDTLVKRLLGKPADAAAVLQTLLPSDICDAIDWGTLERDDRELLAKHDRSTHTDLLFRATARVAGKSHEIELLVVIAHQSGDDWKMPLRVLTDMVGIWRRWLRLNKTAIALPPIVPVLLSHSPGGWRTSRSLDDMFAVAPSELGLGRYSPRLDLLLVDLSAAQREKLLEWAKSLAAQGAVAQGTMLMFLVTMADEGEPAERVERALRDTAGWVESLVKVDPDVGEDLLVYLSLTSQLTNTLIAAILSKQGATTAASKMSTLREMWEQQQREHLQAETRVETLAETLIDQLETKFGDLSDEQRHRVEQADEDMLKKFLKRFAKADSIAAVFAAE